MRDIYEFSRQRWHVSPARHVHNARLSGNLRLLFVFQQEPEISTSSSIDNTYMMLIKIEIERIYMHAARGYRSWWCQQNKIMSVIQLQGNIPRLLNDF